MKKVFRGIGAFFGKIGRWIKNTAWIQPLLIVGGIFALIFAISPTTEWIKSWFSDSNESAAYYKRNDLSWDKYKTSNSEVDKLFKYLDSYGTDSVLEKKFGRKFFLNFVQEDCADCEANYEGFKYLEKNWGKDTFAFKDDSGKVLSSKDEGYEELVIYNIFCDVEKKNDNDKVENLFKTYVYGGEGDSNTERYSELFTNLVDEEFDTYYNHNVNKGNASFYREKIETFTSPTTILIDFDYVDGLETNLSGVSEMLFTIAGKDGTNSLAKAKTLWDCWNHADQFSKNPTTK